MRGVLKTAFNFLLGSGINYLVSFLVLTLLLRYSSQQEYGHFAIAQSVVFWLMPVVQMAMNITAVAQLNRSSQDVDVVQQVIVLRMGALFFVLILMGAFGWMLQPQQQVLMWAFFPLLLANALQLDYYAIARQKAGLLARSQVLYALLYGIGVVVVVTWHLPLWWIPLINGLSMLCAVVWQWHGFLPQMVGQWNMNLMPGVLKVLLGQSALNTFANFIQLGYYTIDLLLLDRLGPHIAGLTGQYAATSRLTQVAVMPIVAILNTLMPRIVQAYHDGDSQKRHRLFRAYLVASWGVGLVGALGLFFLGTPVLAWISDKEVQHAAQVFPVFAVLYLFIGLHSPFSSVLAFMGQEKAYLLCNALAFVVNAAACMLLIPRYGAVGAALSILLGILTLTLVSMWIYFRHRRKGEVKLEAF
ncbi:lipopolysaccharide biosynthesis protein [Deinococcus cellulosilyticus]|uniref:Uncharacterized protein n=1 Tax=Deinococcus cellulosilyticus (strain DSM 18568 / NBRC 106333 / KACC 11606 / 5516J-15) TaxID=1223518 RepID=A0A511MXF2_DEIC1|nr:polysaccharide biosynthesis C-terminal domain-containing protein [Deinococcus cellulosilyticus]GEM45265.1 hypothetical protein DC3_09000 [Deinococcus cellulosilyticus NBRC 106333 = KACC 11606]